MERLTERFKNGQAAVYGCGNNCKYDFKYCNNHLEDCPTINEIYEKLAAYEDLEEQGKLLKLPCAVGDTVYKIYPNDLTDRVLGLTVVAFSSKAMELYGDTWTPFEKIGKTVFLTKEAAEAALKEL